MEYIGEYILKVKNGKVKIPWGFDKAEKGMWLAAESTIDDEKTTRYIIVEKNKFEKLMSESAEYNDDFKIVCKGDICTKNCGIWEVPETILKYLNEGDIVFIGMYDFVEIKSLTDMETERMLLEELIESIIKEE